jgi:hypothetical protein
MTRLSNRLKRLERIASAPLPGDYDFDRLVRATLSELSAPDREIMEAIIATENSTKLIKTHPEVWNRWEQAFNETIVKINFPIGFIAADLFV